MKYQNHWISHIIDVNLIEILQLLSLNWEGRQNNQVLNGIIWAVSWKPVSKPVSIGCCAPTFCHQYIQAVTFVTNIDLAFIGRRLLKIYIRITLFKFVFVNPFAQFWFLILSIQIFPCLSTTMVVIKQTWNFSPDQILIFIILAQLH